MKYTEMKTLFYNFKERKLIVKDLNFKRNDKQAWISMDAEPSYKDDCYYLGDTSLGDCGKFAYYVAEKVRIGVRDEPLPELEKVLDYYKEWKEQL